MERIIINAETTNAPELIGSEKQIAWATDLRNGFFETAEKFINDIARKYEEANCMDEFKTGMDIGFEAVNNVVKHDRCRFWIDRRNWLDMIDEEIDKINNNK